MNKVKEAVSVFLKGFLCSQAILSTYGTQYGLETKIALKLSSPFGAGMGRLGNICGAVNGALMVIGLKYGNSKVSESKKKEKTFTIAREFIKKFESQNESIICKKLLNCDISTLEGRNKAIKDKYFIEICPKFVQDAAEILEELLID